VQANVTVHLSGTVSSITIKRPKSVHLCYSYIQAVMLPKQELNGTMQINFSVSIVNF